MIQGRGLGDNSQIAAGITSGGALTAGGVSSAVATGAITSIAGSTAIVPFIGPIIAGVTLAVGLFLNRNAQYFAQAKATTGIVDSAEPYLKQNLVAWQQSSKTMAEQAQALANFDQIWGQVVQACSSPQYGGPGAACVNDRNRGGRWDWFGYYRDPIANDSSVVATSLVDGNGAGVLDTLSQVTGGIDPRILIVVGGVIAAFVILR